MNSQLVLSISDLVQLKKYFPEIRIAMEFISDAKLEIREGIMNYNGALEFKLVKKVQLNPNEVLKKCFELKQ